MDWQPPSPAKDGKVLLNNRKDMSYGLIKCKWSTREARCFPTFHGTTAAANSQKFPHFSSFQIFLLVSLSQKKHCLTSTKVGTCCYTMSVGVIVGKVLDEPWQALQTPRHPWIEVGWHHIGNLSKVIFLPRIQREGWENGGMFFAWF